MLWLEANRGPAHGGQHDQRPRPRVPPVDPGPALPQRHHVPNVEIDLPGGATIPIGDAASSLCGGMAYTVRDLFEAGLAPPAVTRKYPGDSRCSATSPAGCWTASRCRLGRPPTSSSCTRLPRRRPGHGPRPGLADDPAGVAGHPGVTWSAAP